MAQETEKRVWPFNGYAPGNYLNKCAICEKDMYNVDKLCFVCLECAVRGAQEIIEKYQMESAPKEASTSVEEAAKTLWQMALTFCNNICVRESDTYNGDDDIQEATAASKCAKEIRDEIPYPHLDFISYLQDQLNKTGAEYAQQFQQPVPASIQDRAKRYADEYIGVVGGVSDNKMEDDWETLRAAYTDGAMSMQPATLPVSIIEQLEKANPFESRRTYTTQDMKYNVWVNCVSKLRELTADKNMHGEKIPDGCNLNYYCNYPKCSCELTAAHTLGDESKLDELAAYIEKYRSDESMTSHRLAKRILSQYNNSKKS